MNEYEQEQDFNAVIKAAQIVYDYYEGCIPKIYAWWYLPQEGLDWKSPNDVVTETHGNRLNSLMTILDNE